jgi:hypothetical protein
MSAQTHHFSDMKGSYATSLNAPTHVLTTPSPDQYLHVLLLLSRMPMSLLAFDHGFDDMRNPGGGHM